MPEASCSQTWLTTFHTWAAGLESLMFRPGGHVARYKRGMIMNLAAKLVRSG